MRPIMSIPRSVTYQYAQMVGDLKKDPAEIHLSMDAFKCDILHMAMGINTEVAELMVALENITFLPKYTAAKNVLEELGDAQFYIQGMCQIFGFINDPIVMGDSIVQDSLESYKGFEYVPSHLSPISATVAHAGGIMDYVKRTVIYGKERNVDVPLYHLSELILRLNNIASTFVDDEKHVFEHNEEKLLRGKNARYKEGKYSDAAAQARSDKEPSNPLMSTEPVLIKKHEEPVPSKGPDHHL